MNARRKSHIIRDENTLQLLYKGQHIITLYQNDTVVGTYLTSMRQIPRENNPDKQLYLSRITKIGGDYKYDEFRADFRKYGPNFNQYLEFYGPSCVLGDRQLYYHKGLKSMEDLSDLIRDNKLDEYSELNIIMRDRKHFNIEIIGGDFFHELDIDAVLTVLNYKILPNDLARLLKIQMY